MKLRAIIEQNYLVRQVLFFRFDNGNDTKYMLNIEHSSIGDYMETSTYIERNLQNDVKLLCL